MPRITKNPEDRKQEIIETALELFSEKGYEATTMQDIAEKMGVSQGLCYRYFKSKQEIFSASASYYAQKYIEDLNIPISRELSAIDKLNAVIHRILIHEIKHNEFEASYKKDPEIQMPKVVEATEKTLDVVIPIIRQGVAENSFNCDEIENTARFLMFGVVFLLHPSTMPHENPKDYVLSCRSIIKSMCERVLGLGDGSGIGITWHSLESQDFQ